jgi:hypothetical protein
MWTTSSIEPMQNVLRVRRGGRKDAKKLLFDANLDEIGWS